MDSISCCTRPLVHKQPPKVFYEKGCSQKFRKIYRKTPLPESFLNKATGLRPANFCKFLRAPFLGCLCSSTLGPQNIAKPNLGIQHITYARLKRYTYSRYSKSYLERPSYMMSKINGKSFVTVVFLQSSLITEELTF